MTRTKIFWIFSLLAALSMTAAAQDVAPTKRSLTAEQLAAFKKIQTETERKAAPYAIELAKTAKEIFANMLADREDQRLRKRLSVRLHAAAGRLLDIKGQSFREMLAVLTPDEKRLIRDEMNRPGAPADLADLMGHVFDLPEKK